MQSDEKSPYGNPIIDFDKASKLWRANKRKISRSMFEYCCGAVKKNGEFCKAPPYVWSASYRHRLRKTDLNVDEDDDLLNRRIKRWSYCWNHRHLEQTMKSENNN